MDRRKFLAGLVGTAIASTLPISANLLAAPSTDDWMTTVMAEYWKSFDNFAVYGTMTFLYNDEWPYIHYIAPMELYK